MLIAGGPLAVTDANLVLGRLLPEFFPKIFGPKENEPLDLKATRAAFKKLTQEVLKKYKQSCCHQQRTPELPAHALDVHCIQICSAVMHLGVHVRVHVFLCLGYVQRIFQVNSFMTSQSDTANHGAMTVEEVAMGFIQVANEAMCKPIRALTQAKGYDTSRHVLACFGGAGGQHACAIARALGMKTVFIHR